MRAIRSLYSSLAIAIGALALVSALPAAAQTSTAAENTIPTDPNKTFRVAVSIFKGEGLSADNEYLKQSIPLLIVQTISALQDHYFEDAELRGYRRTILAAAIAGEQAKINSLFQTRSSILFQSSDPTTALETSTKAIDTAEQRLTFLQNLSPEAISVERTKPIELVGGEKGEQLVPYPLPSPAEIAKAMNLGMLVWGSVAQLEDYLVVQIEVYDSALGGTVYNFRKAYSPNDVLNAASDVSNQVVTNILGRDFGTLTLTTNPPSAMIYVDGTFYGVGGSTIRYMKTGKHQLKIRAPGYSPKELVVTISAYQDTKESVALEPVPRPEVVVSSVPGGAAVYVASEWKGRTPVILDRPPDAAAMVLRLKGYHDYSTTISGSTPSHLVVRLMPDLFRSEDYVRGLRNQFYTSFGAFALSMILPVSFYSLMQDYLVNLENTTSPAESERLKNLISVWYYSFLGGAFISSALFANTAMDIADYLGAIH